MCVGGGTYLTLLYASGQKLVCLNLQLTQLTPVLHPGLIVHTRPIALEITHDVFAEGMEPCQLNTTCVHDAFRLPIIGMF